MDCGDGFVGYTYLQTHQVAYMKLVQLSECQLCLNKVVLKIPECAVPENEASLSHLHNEKIKLRKVTLAQS